MAWRSEAKMHAFNQRKGSSVIHNLISYEVNNACIPLSLITLKVIYNNNYDRKVSVYVGFV